MIYETLAERSFVNEEIEEDRRHEEKIINTPIGQALRIHFQKYADVFVPSNIDRDMELK